MHVTLRSFYYDKIAVDYSSLALCRSLDDKSSTCLFSLNLQYTFSLSTYTCTIDGRKGGAMGLQPHLILRALHRISFFTIEIFSCLTISPTWSDYLPPPMTCTYVCM